MVFVSVVVCVELIERERGEEENFKKEVLIGWLVGWWWWTGTAAWMWVKRRGFRGLSGLGFGSGLL
jgi:hypothetical protein